MAGRRRRGSPRSWPRAIAGAGPFGVGVGLGMEDGPEIQAGVAAAHLLVTRASPAATRSVIGVLTGRPVATVPPAPPEPTQDTFHSTVTDAA